MAVRARDTRIGIPPADPPHIFDRFYRADTARDRVEHPAPAGGLGGSGLGPSIAKWIVDAHGGTINIESTVGRGSTFTVTLPLSERPFGLTSEEPKNAGRAASAAAT